MLRERETLLRRNERKTSLGGGNRLMSLRLDKIVPATTKPKKTPIFLPDYETKIERIEATKQNKISAIEVRKGIFWEIKGIKAKCDDIFGRRKRLFEEEGEDNTKAREI